MATSPTFQPPPTWALPVIVDERSGEAIFNPVWLKWFLDFSQSFTPSGGITPGDASLILAGDTFGRQPPSWFAEQALPPVSNLYEVLAAGIFGPRPATFYAETQAQNTQDILAGQIFGA